MGTPSSELAVRDWLRTVPALLAHVGNDPRRIDVEYSGSAESTRLTMYRAGGAPSRWVPIDDAVMAFICWGRGRGAALSLATSLTDVIRSTTETALTDEAWLRGSTVESVSWAPDSDGHPRYIVIARMAVSARQTASV